MREKGKVKMETVTMSIRSMVVLALCAYLVPQTEAAQVTPEQASAAARNWLRGGGGFGRRMGREIETVRALAGRDGAAYHVAAVKGGGFVVLGSDTEDAPVIAVSESGGGEPDERNPLWALLRRDMAARMRAKTAMRRVGRSVGERKAASGSSSDMRWAKLLQQDGLDDSVSNSALRSSAGASAIGDIRVDALVQSAWSQQDYRNYGYTTEDDICYNYYTPNHWPCGCAATAGAQLMRYHTHPTAPVAAGTYVCKQGGSSVELTMKGGTYDWDVMTLVPAFGCSQMNREAIGKLTYDVGVSIGVKYGRSSSSAPGYMLSKRLVDRFQYANAASVVFRDDGFYRDGDYSYSLERFKAAVIPNLDARLPVILEIGGSEGGHVVIGDGYGYSDGDFFIHINLGWANLDNGNVWYMPPDIDEYTSIDGIVYNVYPTGEPGATLVSGRVLNSDGQPVRGASVRVVGGGATTETTSDAKGIYALRARPGECWIVAEMDGLSGSNRVSVTKCVSVNIDEAGSYWSNVRPQIGNICGNDLTLGGSGASERPALPEPSMTPGGEAPYVSAAAVYDGYLYDNRRIVGSVQVKVARGKVDKTGVFAAKVTATVLLLGESRKLSFKGGLADESGKVTGMSAAGHELDVLLGADGLGGKLDGKYAISGARNVFVGKTAEDKTTAEKSLRLYQGTYNVAFDSGTLTVDVGKKGKVKVTGSVDGSKVSATSQLAVGNGVAVVPVVIVKKASLSFCLWLSADGAVGHQGATSVTSLSGMTVGKAGKLGSGAKFTLEPATGFANLSGQLRDYLPNGVGVAQSGRKWIVANGAKAGKPVLDKKTGVLDLVKSKFTANMSGLKLTYKEKDGTFTGSFRVYCRENGKIKPYTAKVTGVMIGTQGYGMATVKNAGTVAVAIR